MKHYFCDICKKRFGTQIATFLAPKYPPDNFNNDFYATAAAEVDICSSCFNRIAKAQQSEIEKIQEEINNAKIKHHWRNHRQVRTLRS